MCSEASNGREAIDLTLREKPDLVVLDLTMPEVDGLEAARVIHKESPATTILVLTMHYSKEIARQVLRCGARGYILKSDAETDLADAINQLRAGRPVITGRLQTTMVESFVAGSDPTGPEEPPIAGVPLSAREIDIIRLLAQGKGNKAIAIALALSTRTIESHRNRIMRKMNFGSFSDLIRFAVRQGLVQL